jgi:hypothetical protein
LEFFAGLEPYRFARRDVDLLPGARVAPDASLSRLYIEDAEAAKFNALTSAQRVLHRLEDRLDGLFGFASRDISLLDDGINYVELDHKGLPLKWKPMLDRELQVVKHCSV